MQSTSDESSPPLTDAPPRDTDATRRGARRNERALVRDSGWASLTGALYSGVVLIGFALALGASPAVIGVLSAIPLFSQLAQLPAVAIVERLRRRRTFTVTVVTVARVIILALAALPYLPATESRLALLVIAQVAITTLGSVAGCSFNSWFHRLVPQKTMGRFLARRLFWSTVAGAIGAASVGLLVDHWPFGDKLSAYSVAFAAAGLAGFLSSHFLLQVADPPMDVSVASRPVGWIILAPLRDPGFRPLIIFMAAWNVASNLAAPFIAVYVLQLGYPLGTVTTLWVVSQLANALTLFLWGRLSDRLSNKSVLSVALPLYFACMLGIAFTTIAAGSVFMLPLLYAFHALMGLASGGIGLASGSLGLKLARPAHATSYLASVSLAAAVAGGLASLAGGFAADWFASSQVSLLLRWTSTAHAGEVIVLRLEHWGFLFALSALIGVYVMHALSRIREEGGTSQRKVIQQFVIEAIRSLDHLSSVEGLRTAALIPLGELTEQRRNADDARSRSADIPSILQAPQGAHDESR